MLVLNTNQSGGGGYKISNENILGAYPDFENSILLTFPFKPGDNFANVKNETALNINGTIINRFCESIVAPQFFTIYKPLVLGSSVGFAPTIMVNTGAANITTPYTCRFGLPGQFKGGEVIGKEIILPEFMTSPYPGTAGYKTMQFKIGLLHADGTITYIADYTNSISGFIGVNGYTNSSTRSNSETSGIYITNKFHQNINTNGYIAQEGDYLIYEMTIVGISTSTAQVYLYFGSQHPINGYGIQYPIQVSID